MANLYNIPKGESKMTLNDVYNGEPVTIQINPRMSIPENAKRYYQKHKNQHIELKNLQDSLAAKRKQVQHLQEIEEAIRNSFSVRDLRGIAGNYDMSPANPGKAPESKPFWEKEIMGYRILIGKSARANDEILRSHSRKNDLWLHAKDVSGSHVLIVNRSEQNYPKPVIERAAAYAAWYSKRKNDSLCPVICTPRKYVRKRKGDPPGAVVVEKEEVLMVVPEG
jgi:predicted ribosome quality control (RQC) complex YloA/Tae2 family protein